MSRLLVLRHGQTDWNRLGRIQGRTDTSLNDSARCFLKRRHVPAEFANCRWYCSPLQRARQTAALLGENNPHLDARLMEMNWGDWEGRTLAYLRVREPRLMAANEAAGLDFRPTGGESPREVCQRVSELLGELARLSADFNICTHQGVIRALVSLATGWDMTDKPPMDLDYNAAQVFALDTLTAQVTVDLINVPLQVVSQHA